ncbi:MAG: flagellar type III secretion system protein FlhB [Pseudomonadota bacterium]
MAEENGDGGEKTYEPTQQRLDEARERGDVAKSTDISAAAAYFGFLIALWVFGEDMAQRGGQALGSFLSRAETLAPRLLDMGGAGLSLEAVSASVFPFAPLFAAPFVLVLVAIVAQRAFVVAPEKLAPKLSRVSPIEQAKNKFGITGLVEFAKSAVKLFAVSVVLGIFLASETDVIIGLSRAEPANVTQEMSRLAVALLIQVAIVAAAISAVDYIWQLADHSRKLRMSHQEVRDEVKRSEGDPQLKAQRRRRAEEIATNRMMLEVPKADVVIVNPTHYAVALKWSRETGGAPVVVAKGVDGVALRIREAAALAGVPIHSDPPTARALEATVEIGREIRPSHYQAVAAAIRFSEAMRAKAKERNG